MKYIYLLHFDKKVGGHASHYCGRSKEPLTRINRHLRNTSKVKIINAAHEQGCKIHVALIMPVPHNKSERAMKDSKSMKRYCKFCNPKWEQTTKKFLERELVKHEGTKEVQLINQLKEVL